jgi:hypothetical protein
MPSCGGIPNYSCNWPLTISCNSLKPNIIDVRAHYVEDSRSRWTGGLTHRSAAARCWVCGFEYHRQAWMSVLWVRCVVRNRSLRRADQSSRVVLPSVVCLSVILKPWQWEGPDQIRAVAPWEMYQSTESVGLQFNLQSQFPFTPRNSPEHSSRICTVSPISKGSPQRVSPRQLYTAANKEKTHEIKVMT